MFSSLIFPKFLISFSIQSLSILISGGVGIPFCCLPIPSTSTSVESGWSTSKTSYFLAVSNLQGWLYQFSRWTHISNLREAHPHSSIHRAGLHPFFSRTHISSLREQFRHLLLPKTCVPWFLDIPGHNAHIARNFLALLIRELCLEVLLLQPPQIFHPQRETSQQ